MQPIDRRTFIADLGRGAFALAVVSVAACSPGSSGHSATLGFGPGIGVARGFADRWSGAVGVVRRGLAALGQSPCP